MKRELIPIPKPRSSFLLVKCPNCGEERVFFTHTTTPIKCRVCGALLAEPTGGRAVLHAPVIRRLD
jgi:small subunit ribosomal protein S27e